MFTIDEKIIIDNNSLIKEYKSEPQSKYVALINSYFDPNNKLNLEEGYKAASKTLCFGEQYDDIKVFMMININTDASISTHFLFSHPINKEMRLHLRENTTFRDFTKLSIYIKEYYKGIADKRLLSDSCVVISK